MARMRVCAQPNCPHIQAEPRCPEHRARAERARGTRQQRGYDAKHDGLRVRWKPRVDRGSVHCHAQRCLMPSGRLILPGQPWDLGHTADRTSWTGPEHAVCNRSAGGTAAHSA